MIMCNNLSKLIHLTSNQLQGRISRQIFSVHAKDCLFACLNIKLLNVKQKRIRWGIDESTLGSSKAK